MSDNNPHHPGVRSLLAKFEGQSPIASPPPRGRSPAASDSSGTVRQLSKVRASFVTVDGIVQSNPASPLRKTSGRSDSPGIFGPKINSGDAESGRQTMISPTPLSRLDHTQNATMGQIMAEGRPEEAIETKSELTQTAKEEPATHTETESQLRNTPPKQTEEPIATDSKLTSSDTPSQKSNSSGAIKKKPSSVGSARSAASKSVSTTAASTGAKPAAHKTTSKPTAREVAKERANSLAHKPSRVSLNPKATARPTRGSALTQDTSKPPTAGVSSKPGMKSPPKPARVPGSMHTSTQASGARPGSTGAPSTRTTASTLTRKPSTLKSATRSQSRATTPSASVRREASRPSLPAQAAHDASTKPVNEGFLARMMRPTASSANKSHPQEKSDAKPVTRTTSVSKAPRPSIGRVPDRGVPHAKPKTTALRPQSQKSQALNKEPAPQKDGAKPSQKKQESEKENIVEPIIASLKEPTTVEPAPVAAVGQPEAVSKPVEETASPAQVEESTPEAAIVSTEPTEKSIEVPEPVIEETVAEISSDPVPIEAAAEVPAEPIDSNEAKAPAEAEVDAPAETLIEPIAGDAEEGASKTTTATEEIAAEPVAIPTADDQVKVSEDQETSMSEPEVLETPESTEVHAEPEKEDDVPVNEAIVPETLAEVAEENPTEAKSAEPAPDAQPTTEDESSNVAIDIATLSLH
ncbi:hypothetical protein N7447_000583 [Penicillium robsamsonii]|uniref:uncharacterized protein n=1 Tax=Penicillium robsamsonii TaxID=1792511 RepID=UPI00254719F9|nr:uncharacterized protein N7447_000583 [Penicillium robsamsonii]KAJ5834557.1 hypothetical protein N7447_000583 [Penicillium robsamsonii]